MYGKIKFIFFGVGKRPVEKVMEGNEQYANAFYNITILNGEWFDFRIKFHLLKICAAGKGKQKHFKIACIVC